MQNKPPLIILSAGGTGGHVAPAAALGHELRAHGFRVEVVTDERGAQYGNMFGGLAMHVLPSGTLGAGMRGKIRGLSNLARGILKARTLMKKLKPALVVGFGGYPSVPGVYAAQRLKIPTLIHEQNAVLGKANALLAGRARRIALSWPAGEAIKARDKSRCVVTGNPVRADIANIRDIPYPPLEEGGVFNIFVVGGSLGAKIFSEVVPVALGQLSLQNRNRLRVVQQCRKDDLETVRALYKQAGIQAELAVFYDDVAARLSNAHLLIARSGASTVAEVAVAGRPAIFVPYPHHKDHSRNATPGFWRRPAGRG